MQTDESAYGRLAALAQKLDVLTSDHAPLWGDMSAQHMVEHLTDSLKISNGETTVQQFTDEEKIPALRAFLMSDRPMPRNFRSPANGEGLRPLRHPNLDSALAVLKNELARFHQFHEANHGSRPVNPVFGPLSYNQWIQFHQKHFQHHLSQFGLI
ncbi:MAG: hypothetical protein ACNA8K_00760 [Cyclonatronaceae bacterium]